MNLEYSLCVFNLVLLILNHIVDFSFLPKLTVCSL